MLTAFAGQPAIAAALLRQIGDDSVKWDARPDSERFSLREVMAHLADWEEVWLDRARRISSEARPFLPSVDEELLVIQHGYASQNGSESLARYASGREALVDFLRSRSPEDWERTGNREFVGELTLYQQVAMALSHDGYHMHQIVEWLRA